MRSTKNTGHKEETYADLYGCGTGRAPTGKENIRTDETSLYRNRAYFAGTIKGAGKHSRTGAHKCRRDRGDVYKRQVFENCVADVNIPVGEVFTSPKLTGTTGLLHVSGVYLDGLYYKDLVLSFTDGMVTDCLLYTSAWI